MRIKTVALLGAGAVGAYFIWGLSEKLGEDFFVIAKDERKKKLEKDGLVINGKKYDLSVQTPKEAGPVDLVLVASKQDALEDALEDIRLLTGENTIVISLLNGVRSEEIIGAAIGEEHMLYATMRIASERKGNQIRFIPEDAAGIFVGEKDSKEPTKRLRAVEALFCDTQIHYHLVGDIMTELWCKYASNVSQNLPQAVLGVGFGAYRDSEHVYYLAKRLWEEVAMVANAKGIPLSKELKLFSGSKPYARFSTLQDLDAGRHTEIETFAGDMIRMGEMYGIPVPYCEYTYHLIRAMEEKNDGKIR